MIQEEDFLKFLGSKNLDTSLTLQAFRQARKSHKTHKRFSGKPEFNDHILVVAREVILSYGEDDAPEHVIASALLHDVLEDDPEMSHARFQKIFPKNVYKIFAALTKKPEDNHPDMTEKEIYKVNQIVVKKLASEDFEIQLIKLSDRYSNIVNLEEIKHIRPNTYTR